MLTVPVVVNVSDPKFAYPASPTVMSPLMELKVALPTMITCSPVALPSETAVAVKMALPETVIAPPLSETTPLLLRVSCEVLLFPLRTVSPSSAICTEPLVENVSEPN